jgi:hypothetical protein
LGPRSKAGCFRSYQRRLGYLKDTTAPPRSLFVRTGQARQTRAPMRRLVWRRESAIMPWGTRPTCPYLFPLTAHLSECFDLFCFAFSLIKYSSGTSRLYGRSHVDKSERSGRSNTIIVCVCYLLPIPLVTYSLSKLLNFALPQYCLSLPSSSSPKP